MPDLGRIVRCAIHPAVGIARVGNAADAFFIGPEAPGRTPDPAGGYKDDSGAVKRQAARFRIYGFDASGQVVAELTADNAEITWRVELANRKAAWYAFGNAMDLGSRSLPETQRNAAITGNARRSLAITPSPARVSGRNADGTGAQFADGRFMNLPVYLGELRTDAAGRLLVLGGRGASAAPAGTQATTFANNDGWHDDVADGPVRASVRIGPQTFEADGAVVAVTPPNFAPGLHGVVTMYDVLIDLFQREFGWAVPDGVAFWRDVYPLLDRLVQLQAVNAGALFLFGPGSQADFGAIMDRLADPSPAHAALREAIFKWFRGPAMPKADGTLIPPIYGDDFPETPEAPGVGLEVTALQYDALRRWAEGAFEFGADPRGATPPTLEELPLQEQPHALDRANLEDCLGGPFHPGIELTWPVRLKRIWREPFRLNLLAEATAPRDDWGPTLTPEVALSADGPYAACGPGTLTRVLGVPWQTDEASCDAGYEAGTYLPSPSFWAARVPNHVMDERSYLELMDTSLPVLQRLKHFAYRQPWLRFFSPLYQQRINSMVANWAQLGIVVPRPGPVVGIEGLAPDRLWVETEVNAGLTRQDATYAQLRIAQSIQQSAPAPIHAFAAPVSAAALPELAHHRRHLRRDER